MALHKISLPRTLNDLSCANSARRPADSADKVFILRCRLNDWVEHELVLLGHTPQPMERVEQRVVLRVDRKPWKVLIVEQTRQSAIAPEEV